MSRILSGPAEERANELARSMGIARLVISGPLLIAPIPAVRLLGMDSATAKRVAFLARMTAVRDAGIGVGTLASRGTDQVGVWLAVGAASDAVDALALAGAGRAGVLHRASAAVSAVVAAGAAGFGAWTALRALRER